MSGIFPLVGILLIAAAVGLFIAALLAIIYRKSLRQKWPLIVGAPIGCIATPIVALVALIGFSSVTLTQPTDQQLYHEIFGYTPSMGDDRMLANDNDGNNDRAIFLRAEVTAAEKKRLLAVPGLAASDLTMSNIIGVGESRGFSWWIEREPFMEYQGCENGQIFEAPGFNRWTDFVIVECPQPANHEFMRLGHTDLIYIIATR